MSTKLKVHLVGIQIVSKYDMATCQMRYFIPVLWNGELRGIEIGRTDFLNET